MPGKSRQRNSSSHKSRKSVTSQKSQKSAKSVKSRKSTKKSKKTGNGRPSDLSFMKSTPISTITSKVNDLKGDVECLRAKYGCGNDSDKDKIDQVLCNMRRKLETAERILKIGQNVTNSSASLEITRVLIGRIKTIKKLVKDLKKEKGKLTKQERRCISQMCHQLLSMADEMCHFADPYRASRSSACKCKDQEEPYWTSIKDCETQVGAEIPDDSPQAKTDVNRGKLPISPCLERPSPCKDRTTSTTGRQQSDQNQPISPCMDGKKKPQDSLKSSTDRPKDSQISTAADKPKSSVKIDDAENTSQVFCSEVVSVRPEIDASSCTSFENCWQSLSFSVGPSDKPFEVVDLSAPRYDLSKSQCDYETTFRYSVGPPTVAAFSLAQWGTLSSGENNTRASMETEL